MSRVNLKTHPLLIPERHVLPKFDPVDTIRLHGMGVKFSETLMIEVSKKEGLQKSSCPPACMSAAADCPQKRTGVRGPAGPGPLQTWGNP